MKFFAPVLLAGLAAASPCAPGASTKPYSPPSTQPNATAPDPSTYDNIEITDLLVREQLNGNTLQVVGIELASFTLNGNVSCEADAPTLDGKVFGCGSTPYSFGLINGTTTDFALRIYKATSQFGGRYGVGDVPTYCRSGGGSIEICQQVADTTIVITGQNGISK